MVFISYSSKDAIFAQKLRNKLISDGVPCWMAPDSIPPGDDYANTIPDAIEACTVFLLILSKKSQNSNWVPKELDSAITLQKQIIPYKIDNEPLSKSFFFRLENVKPIMVAGNEEQAYLYLVNRIQCKNNKTVKSILGGPPEFCSFFQMLGIHDIAQLRINRLRTDLDSSNTLKVPVGIGNHNEMVYVDIHPKGDGPNGLIIGPSGCGKTEFLTSLCLSLCLHYSSQDVRLLIVDPEGMLVQSLQQLPHVYASLSENSEAAVNKFIKTVDDEICYRRRLFDRVSVTTIAQYRNLRKRNQQMEELPYLLFVVDEIVNLKPEHPTFFAKITEWGSTQEASSLGILFLLSTKAYEGTVDDGLHAIIDYRLSSVSQKNELLYKNQTKDLIPGRFFIQSASHSTLIYFQVACTQNPIENDMQGFEWFFPRRTQLQEIIDQICKFEKT